MGSSTGARAAAQPPHIHPANKSATLLSTAEGGIGRSCQSPAKARAQDVHRDLIGFCVSAGDYPKRHREWQGRAERYDDGLELRGITHPHANEKLI